MTDRFIDRLSEYVDGDLSLQDAGRVEAHLRGCEDCAQALDELRAVVRRASALTERDLPADLWPGIATRIEAEASDGAARLDARATGTGAPWRRRYIALSIPQLAAAAILLVALTGGTAWLVAPRALHETPGGLTTDETGPGGGVPAAITAADAELGPASAAVRYAVAIDELEQALLEPGVPLPPSTEAKIRNSLRTIDRAIADARRALEEAPTDGYLRQHLTSTMRRKIDFLRRTTRLVAQS